MKKYGIFFVVTFILIVVTACGAKSKNTPITNLVNDTIEIKEASYVPKNLAWLSSMEEIKKQKKLTQENLKEDRISDDITCTKPKADGTVIYNFDNNKLISMEYCLSLEKEEDAYLVYKEIVEELLHRLPNPKTAIPDLSKKEMTPIMWTAEDKSSITVSVPSATEKKPYVVILKLTAPNE